MLCDVTLWLAESPSFAVKDLYLLMLMGIQWVRFFSFNGGCRFERVSFVDEMIV